MHNLEMPLKVKRCVKNFLTFLFVTDVVPLLDVNYSHVLHQILLQCKCLATPSLLAAVRPDVLMNSFNMGIELVFARKVLLAVITALTEWQEWGPVWTLNSVDRRHMYCVVVLHISYDDRLRTVRYEVTTQRHVGIAAQRWCEHRMESRRRRQAVSGTAHVIFCKPLDQG